MESDMSNYDIDINTDDIDVTATLVRSDGSSRPATMAEWAASVAQSWLDGGRGLVAGAWYVDGDYPIDDRALGELAEAGARAGAHGLVALAEAALGVGDPIPDDAAVAEARRRIVSAAW
jgi:hypothetical protein